MKCPICEGAVDVFYTAPVTYKCRECRADLVNLNERPAVTVLSEDMARRKRPAMYGDPVCHCCTHAPHLEGECEFCKYESLNPPVTLMSRSTLSPRDQERLKAIEDKVREERKQAEEDARAPDEGRYYKD